MATYAKCADVTPPADGSDFSACTSVVWVTDQNLTWTELQPLVGPALLFLLTMWILSVLRKS